MQHWVVSAGHQGVTLACSQLNKLYLCFWPHLPETDPLMWYTITSLLEVKQHSNCGPHWSDSIQHLRWVFLVVFPFACTRYGIADSSECSTNCDILTIWALGLLYSSCIYTVDLSFTSLWQRYCRCYLLTMLSSYLCDCLFTFQLPPWLGLLE